MPPLIKKTPTHEPPKPKTRQTLKDFVDEKQYVHVKARILERKDDGFTLRQIWAVVDHMIEVSAGREIEVYAAVGKKAVVNQSSATKPGTRLSRR